MRKKHKDLLIVGQGIAGTMLAWHAERAGLSFDIFDKGSLNSASAVSSGIINPITGPKYVKSWMINNLLPQARSDYEAIGKRHQREFVRDIPIWRHIPSNRAENLWNERMLDPNYQGFLDKPLSSEIDHRFQAVNRFGIVSKGLLVDMRSLLSTLRAHWISNQMLIESDFDEEHLQVKEGVFQYDSKGYKHIILAMGYKGIRNKWFASDDYAPVKGEVLIGKLDKWPTDKIIKFGKFIVPLKEEYFWIGSNYQHQFDNQHPDPEKAAELKDFINEKVRADFELTDHIAGIRPSTKFRRPFIGEHPSIKNLFLFNGLGTKGISIAPYFSCLLINSIKERRTFTNTDAFDRSYSKPPGR